MVERGVPGFNETPTCLPVDLMRSITSSGLSAASIWNVIPSAPALAKGSTSFSGLTTII